MKSLSTDAALVQRLLETIEQDVLPLTEEAVRRGNKVFGAALLKKSDRSTFLAETNNEMESPLHHGEMHLLKRYYELSPAERLPPGELIFLSTHEPCSMCLSAITWAGFDNFYYFFSHMDSRDAFAIPHDLKILKEVFDVDPGNYHRSNAFWQCEGIREWIAQQEDALASDTRKALDEKVESICQRYAEASRHYQSSKSGNSIPLN
ncbi:nucleoside deaminase [Granulosicoccus sp. 3-233]|uniref:nucleoside deaminase n=1 Tax=Granulosicoccus sp. 3-233 TaxID=3417969 RepID=UPI003D34D544